MIFCWANWNQSYFLVFVKTYDTEVQTYVLSASSQNSPGLPTFWRISILQILNELNFKIEWIQIMNE